MTLYQVDNTMKHRRRSQSTFTWNDEATGFAKQCHADGLTATQAAVMLNRKFGGRPTRSSVCGFWWRHGLHRAASSAAAKDRAAARLAARTAKQSQRRAQQRAARISAMATDNAQALAETMLDTASFVPAKEHRKQLLELTNTTCRWPYGDPGTPDFFFCGNDRADLESKRPYCPRHMETACAHVPKYSEGYTRLLSMLGR